jgi:predicted amidophosphoribosyltransferase
VGIPYWFITLMSASACALMVWRWRRRRVRTGPGSCARCGYDLRGSSERCPECGTPFSSQAGRVSTAAGRA